MTLNQKDYCPTDTVKHPLNVIDSHFLHWEVHVFYLMYSKSHYT